MAEESEALLHSQLNKLELEPFMTTSSKLPGNSKMNPFVMQYQQSVTNQVTQEELFGPTCNCSSQKHAQGTSAILNFSQGHSRQFNKNNKNTLFLDKNIRNAVQFKQKSIKNDKRSNVLKASKFLEEVGKCIHNKQFRIEKEEGPVYNKLVKAKSFGDLTGKGLDFKELLKQCSSIQISTPLKSSILIKNISFMRNEDVLSNDFTRSCFKTIRISSSLIPKLYCPAITASNKFPRQRRNSIATTEEKISSMNLNSSAGGIPSTSSSCSQQALININPGSTGDVTIDEIASYFENILFIPKKMSEMAEMMYI